ncbi:hypothetical protein JG688_00013748 [Phytophthora aleatoria]|uniref:Uncharacterized protein n=1 Tax=Phytophthora aleatoria TaxID=2496075 RepID=A0A8J5IY23_9STRA|nr:hypothetical protein JG688_00013748 [Phytophthora aleatoria]
MEQDDGSEEHGSYGGEVIVIDVLKPNEQCESISQSNSPVCPDMTTPAGLIDVHARLQQALGVSGVENSGAASVMSGGNSAPLAPSAVQGKGSRAVGQQYQQVYDRYGTGGEATGGASASGDTDGGPQPAEMQNTVSQPARMPPAKNQLVVILPVTNQSAVTLRRRLTPVEPENEYDDVTATPVEPLATSVDQRDELEYVREEQAVTAEAKTTDAAERNKNATVGVEEEVTAEEEEDKTVRDEEVVRDRYDEIICDGQEPLMEKGRVHEVFGISMGNSKSEPPGTSECDELYGEESVSEKVIVLEEVASELSMAERSETPLEDGDDAVNETIALVEEEHLTVNDPDKDVLDKSGKVVNEDWEASLAMYFLARDEVMKDALLCALCRSDEHCVNDGGKDLESRVRSKVIKLSGPLDNPTMKVIVALVKERYAQGLDELKSKIVALQQHD